MVTKIAVGIFAGGVVFEVLLPELRIDLGFTVLDSFWVGSVAVVVLTGVYTVVGGLRAVAYTDTLQTIIFIIGSALVTVFGLIELGGWNELRAGCGSEMFNLWRPLAPPGMVGTWEPVRETGRIAWYFNDNFPWLGMLFLRRSWGCGIGARTSTSCSEPWGRRVSMSLAGAASSPR